MKRILQKVMAFLVLHIKLSIFINAVIVVISGIAAIYSNQTLLLAVCFGTSLAALFRLVVYHVGKIPIFMSDKLWDRYRLKYSEEKLDEKYKETSIKRASIYFSISIVLFLVWIICEVFLRLPDLS